MKRFSRFLVALSLLIGGAIHAQSVSGTVVDEFNEPLPSVAISVDKGGATSTNFNGQYSLSLKPGKYAITYSFIGYEPDDQSIAIDPPATERNPFYHFPTKVKIDDVITLRYENWREEKASMQNLSSDDCYAYAKVVYTDGTSQQIENTFNVGSNPDLQMQDVGDGNFEMLIVPTEHFNLNPMKEVDYLEFIAMRKNFASGADRVTEAVVIPIFCQ